MRFKKLKIAIGVSLLLFVLIVGNVIAFGLLENKPLPGKFNLSVTEPMVTPIETKKIVSPPPVTKLTNTSSTIQTTVQPIKSQTQSTPQPQSPPPQKTVVVHTKRKTRAS